MVPVLADGFVDGTVTDEAVWLGVAAEAGGAVLVDGADAVIRTVDPELLVGSLEEELDDAAEVPLIVVVPTIDPPGLTATSPVEVGSAPVVEVHPPRSTATAAHSASGPPLPARTRHAPRSRAPALRSAALAWKVT